MMIEQSRKSSRASMKSLEFTVFEEPDVKCQVSIGVQTETSISDAAVETTLILPLDDENPVDTKETELKFWNSVVSARRIALEKSQIYNEKLEAELEAAMASLKEKQQEYQSLFKQASDQLEDDDDDPDNSKSSPA